MPLWGHRAFTSALEDEVHEVYPKKLKVVAMPPHSRVDAWSIFSSEDHL